jgi:hypothetical protein
MVRKVQRLFAGADPMKDIRIKNIPETDKSETSFGQAGFSMIKYVHQCARDVV